MQVPARPKPAGEGGGGGGGAGGGWGAGGGDGGGAGGGGGWDAIPPPHQGQVRPYLCLGEQNTEWKTGLAETSSFLK